MDWRHWCRLCGNDDSLIKIEITEIEIAKKLGVKKIQFFFNNYLRKNFI